MERGKRKEEREYSAITNKKESLAELFLWALTDSNRRPSACKADALNQLS